MHHNVRPHRQRPHQGRRGHGGVHDERCTHGVGQLGHGGNVHQTQAGIAGHFAKNKAGLFVNFLGPFVVVQRIGHPAHLDAPLTAVSFTKKHEAAAVTFGADHNVGPWLWISQKGIGGHKNGRHAGTCHAAAHLAIEAVPFQQGERLFQVADSGVGDAAVGPGGHQVGQGGFHVVAVFKMLGRTQVGWLDDAALVGQRGFGIVDTVHGDGVELFGFHDGALVSNGR